MIGDRFGRLKIVAHLGGHRETVICKCDCGVEKAARLSHLKSGATQSCGCLQKEAAAQANKRHGHYVNNEPSPEYRVWAGMKGRCYSRKNTSYPRYGGSGVTVCERWRFSFPNFLADMGPRPPGYTIDRIDAAGNYEPGNCRWATYKEQNRRRKSDRLTMEKAAQIRALRQSGMKIGKIAACFGVSTCCARAAADGVTWT